MNLGGRSQLVGRVRGRPPSGRVQRRARAASRCGDLAIDVLAVGFVSDSLVTVAATGVLLNGLAEARCAMPLLFQAAVQLANFSSSSSIASLSLPQSPPSPPPPSSLFWLRQSVLWQWARCRLALGEACSSGLCCRQWAREDAARSCASTAARQQVDGRSSDGDSAGVAAGFVRDARRVVAARASAAAAVRNQAASQAAEAAEERPLLPQGRGIGGLGGVGGRCDRSRSARATVSVACVRSGVGPKRSVLRQVSQKSVGAS